MNLQESNLSTYESSAARRLIERGRNKLFKTGAIAAIGVAALSACAPSEASTPTEPAPQGIEETTTPAETTAPVAGVEPTEVETPVEVGAEALRIPADLPAEELARALVELENTWMFAGTTEDTIEETGEEQIRLIQEDGLGYDEAFIALAEKHADYYDDAMLIEGWEENPETVAYREYLVTANAALISDALENYRNNEPLPYWTSEVREVKEVETTEGERIVSFVTTVTPHNSTAEPGDLSNAVGFDTKTGSALVHDIGSSKL